MEHRWQRRIRTDFGAVLYLKGRRPVVCRARNMTAEGVFLSLLEPIPGLEVISAVDLEIFYPTQGSPMRQKASGIVAHRSREGVGLMLRGDQLEPLSTISKLKVGQERVVPKGIGESRQKRPDASRPLRRTHLLARARPPRRPARLIAG